MSEAEDQVQEATLVEEPSPEETGEQGALRAPVAALLAWLVPGAGHLFLGKKGRAAGFFLIVLSCAAIGCGLEGRLDTIEENNPLSVIATLASLGSGAVHLVLKFLASYEGNIVAAGYEYGTTFLRTAGILNLLLVLDAFDIGRGRKS